MTDSRTGLDETIDRAVRDMMRQEPPAGFRRRVLSRLDATARRSQLWLRLVAAAGTLAVVALAFGVLRDRPVEPRRDVRVSPGAPAPGRQAVRDPASRSEVGIPAAGRQPRRAPQAEQLRTATFGPRDGRVSAASLTPLAHLLPASIAAAHSDTAEETLPLAPAIVVPPLTPPDPIEIAPIVVTPLQIRSIESPPVSSPR